MIHSIKNNPLVFPVLICLYMASICSAVTLISKSNGLNLPSKEEGNTEFETADVNNDGYLDIVSVGDHGSPGVNSDQHGIMVWLGDGSGQWAVHQSGQFGYGGCAIGDLNLDGIQDIAWGIHHNWSSGMGNKLMNAALGDGTGQNWIEWGSGLGDNGEDWGMFATALADFNCDGRLDIVSLSFGGSNGVRLYGNNGDGSWTQEWAQTGGSVGYTIETCDVNSDGFPDIVCTRSGTEVFLGDGMFGFTVSTAGLPSGSIRGIDAGDIDGNGSDDISFATGSGGIRCCKYDTGTNTWIDISNGLPSSGFFELSQIGDINGDGNADIVVFKSPVGQIFLGDGAGNWTADAPWTMPAPGDVSALRVDGDIDHDGREDILISASKEGFPFYRNQLRCYSAWEEPASSDVKIIFPNGGETLQNGSIREIRWLSAVPVSHENTTATIEFSVDQGPWNQIAADQPNSGKYQWMVYSQTASQSCRLKVTVRSTQGSSEVQSEADFAIVGTAPNTPVPTATPTLSPTNTPAIPTATPTPECMDNAVLIYMPAAIFHAGDPFSLTAEICNAEKEDFTDLPLFVLLDVYGEYWFAPSWISEKDGLDYYKDLTFKPGITNITIIEQFDWPANAGKADDIFFYAALLTPEMDRIFGIFSQAEFSWE